MSTHSDRSTGIPAERTIVVPQFPSFAAFVVRNTHDSDEDLCHAEAALLHPSAVAARRETFRLGRLAAHAALESMGLDTGPIMAGTSREPLWPRGVAGSISHIPGTAVALVAMADHSDGVGVDIESIRIAPELENQVPRPEERSWLDSLSKSDRATSLFSLFSAKESIFKAFFPNVGSFFGFQAASLTPTSSGFSGRLVKDIDSRYPSTREFEVECRWSGTIVMTWVILPKTT